MKMSRGSEKKRSREDDCEVNVMESLHMLRASELQMRIEMSESSLNLFRKLLRIQTVRVMCVANGNYSEEEIDFMKRKAKDVAQTEAAIYSKEKEIRRCKAKLGACLKFLDRVE